MTLELTPFDMADHLGTEELVRLYVEEAIKTGEPAFIAKALGTVARSRGMAKIAKASGLSRESLYRSLSSEGNPELATIIKVLDALGMELSVQTKQPDRAA